MVLLYVGSLARLRDETEGFFARDVHNVHNIPFFSSLQIDGIIKVSDWPDKASPIIE